MRASVHAAVIAIAAALVFAACSGTPKNIGGVQPNDAIVKVECPVQDASIRVNGTDIGSVKRLARGGFALSPGTHRLEIRHDDYHSHYQILELTAKQRLSLSIALAKRLP